MTMLHVTRKGEGGGGERERERGGGGEERYQRDIREIREP